MIFVLLPAYNEENDLPGLLGEFERFSGSIPFRLILINDGSTDRTLESAEAFARRLPLEIVSHEKNLGLGRALMTGFAHVRPLMMKDDLLVTMDSDNTHKPQTINLLAAALGSGYGAAIASRFAKGAEVLGVPLTRRLLSACAGLILSFLFPVSGVKDYTSGYRAFTAGTVERLFAVYGEYPVTEAGFAATLEILLKARKSGIKIAEVPIRLLYGQKAGSSKIRIPQTVARYAVLAAKMLVRL